MLWVESYVFSVHISNRSDHFLLPFFRKLWWLELPSISLLFGLRTKLYTRAENSDGRSLTHTHYTYPTDGINILRVDQCKWSSRKRLNVTVLRCPRTRRDRESHSRSYKFSFSLFLGCCNLDGCIVRYYYSLVCSRWPLPTPHFYYTLAVVLDTHPHLTPFASHTTLECSGVSLLWLDLAWIFSDFFSLMLSQVL